MHLFRYISFLISKTVVINLHSPVNLCQIAVRNKLRWLITDTNLEARRTPVDELNRPLGLDASDGSVYLLRDNITTVEQAGGHVFSVTGIALDHLVVRLETGVGDLLDGVGLVGGPGCRDDRGVGNQREMNTGVWDKIGLELIQINVEGAVETKRSSDTRNNYLDWSTTIDQRHFGECLPWAINLLRFS